MSRRGWTIDHKYGLLLVGKGTMVTGMVSAHLDEDEARGEFKKYMDGEIEKPSWLRGRDICEGRIIYPHGKSILLRPDTDTI